MSDKIEQDVERLLPCIQSQICVDYGGHHNWCPAFARPAVVAWARGLVAELKAERDEQIEAIQGLTATHEAAIRALQDACGAWEAERDAALADANDWRNRVAPEMQMLGDQLALALAHQAEMRGTFESIQSYSHQKAVALQAERDAAHVEIARLKGALDIELVRGMEAADAAHVAGMREAMEIVRRNKDFKGYLHEIVADEIADAIKAREDKGE